jgi:hypothetical protein
LVKEEIMEGLSFLKEENVVVVVVVVVVIPVKKES